MKGRKHRETGGANEPEEDVKTKPEERTNAKKIDSEAEEMKKGGRAKRKHGGKTEVGKVDGEHGMHHAGRKPRKSGGKASSDQTPFTSARKGEDPPGRKVMKGEVGMGED
jgi:hypothetical protein